MGLNRVHLDHAITVEEHRALTAGRGRPLTGSLPIGATTASRRAACALASEIVTDHAICPVDVTPCPTGCRCEGCRLVAATHTARETSRRGNARRRAKQKAKP